MNQYDELCSQCAELARSELARLACAGIYPQMYLYHRAGELRLASDAPGPDWQLGSSAMPCSLPSMQVHTWVREHARRLPILTA